MEITEIDGVKWVTLTDAAEHVGKQYITLYKAHDSGRLASRILAGVIVVDLDEAERLYPQAETEAVV